MSRSALLWLVPLLLLVHNIEEALFISHFLPLASDLLPGALRSLLPAIVYPAFLVALLIVTGIPFLVAALGQRQRWGTWSTFLLLAVQAVLLLNVLSHLGSAFLLRGYAPGLATALLLNLPFSVYLFRRAAGEHWISRRALLALPAVALVLHGPVLLGLLLVAGWLVGAP